MRGDFTVILVIVIIIIFIIVIVIIIFGDTESIGSLLLLNNSLIPIQISTFSVIPTMRDVLGFKPLAFTTDC
jgi:hypothetical protein